MAGLNVTKEDRPSYVKFDRRPVEDRAASIREGHYVAKDVDFALITPQGSKDQIIRKVDEWFVQMKQQVVEERLPQKWYEGYVEAYGYWQKGQEAPLNGTPIKGWQVLSPAMQENVIHANILTVEDLAQINEEAARRIGMGSLEMRDKAISWIKGAAGPGKLSQEMAALQVRQRMLEEQNAKLAEDNKELQNAINQLSKGAKKEG